MTERPILFQGAMVRAILDGSKTQTRRVAKITHRTPGLAACLEPPVGAPRPRVAAELCPYGQPGDRLWVRETWAYHLHAMGSLADDDGPWVYAADGKQALQHRLCDRWRPSIHMPRYVSRLKLEITGVRVERLQDISEADAITEGIEADVQPGDAVSLWRNYATGGTTISPIYSYQTLWESINGPGSWEANPWVWVVEFGRVGP